MQIRIFKDTETIRYAAEELQKYLGIMDSTIDTEIVVSGEVSDGAITLGILADLGRNDSDVEDYMLDDVIDVEVNKLSGIIAGSNERSVLMGVYELLKSAGCAFVRPSPDGDFVPKKAMADHSFTYRKKADFRFRGQCIEGAISYEHVFETVKWMPKVNMNLFMIEQIIPYNYMNRWYRHIVSTRKGWDPEPPYEQYAAWCLQLEKDIKKFGLQLHVMGHGALNEPFGVRHMISGMKYTVSEDVKKALALVDGVRDIHGNSPFFTQVCMSQEWVQDKIVNWLANYLEEKPYIDFLHFWLADNINNHCECEECKKHHPSDLYVRMLNKLDAELTKRGNPAKIIFIMYVDTLWAPIVEKLNNPSRFIMTTAWELDNISGERSPLPLPKWERNHYPSIDQSFGTCLNFIDQWKPAFDGAKFIYAYWLYTEHFTDPGYMNFSKGIASDLKKLDQTGFDGIMSDQTQRAYFPTALPASMIGEIQFDKNTDSEKYIENYMKGCFGADYKLAQNYLQTVSDLFDKKALKQNTSIVAQDTGANDNSAQKAGIFGNTAAGERIATVYGLVDDFAAVVARNAQNADPCIAKSWKLLEYHGEYCKLIAAIYICLSKNDIDGANAALAVAIDRLSEIEPEIHYYFDLVLFNQRMSQIIAGR